MSIFARFRRPAPHRHEYDWTTEVWDSVMWRVFAKCRVCESESFSCVVASRNELSEALDGAFRDNRLSALGYFTAPVDLPRRAGVS